jgi:hypothetical protein
MLLRFPASQHLHHSWRSCLPRDAAVHCVLWQIKLDEPEKGTRMEEDERKVDDRHHRL